MTGDVLPPGVDRPDFYVAAIGRSGSTLLCNWLCRPPDHLVFIEPLFLGTSNPRLLRIQLEDFGMAAQDVEWERRDETGAERFRRLMGPRLAGRQWAFKEVLCEQHFEVLDALVPKRVIVTVRNLEDVALSFFEKHRLQGNLDRFDRQWVVDYCRREGAGILRFLDRLESGKVPHVVLRYEDFTHSDAARAAIADFVGWEGGGRIDSHLERFDRQFEIDRHGGGVSSRPRSRDERRLAPGEAEIATAIGTEMAAYQNRFGYL